MGPHPLLEREAEVAALATLLDEAAQGRGGTALVAGPPGAGKSRLVAFAERAAAERGMRVVAAPGVALEASFAFGVARRLLDDGDTALGDARGDLGATVHALHWRLLDMAQWTPLLVAVDDAQWADGPSLRLLGYLARRIAGAPVALVLAERREGGPGPATAALEGAGVAALEPAPLTGAGVTSVLAGALGTAPGSAFAQACHERTGGNPFLVAELAGHLRATGTPPDDDRIADLAGALPGGVAASVARRLAALPPSARALAQALAVLGDGTDTGLAGALAGLAADEAADAAAALAGAGLIDDAQPLRFRHPLIRDAVAADGPSLARAAAHGRAARLLDARGAPPGLVAAHLLEAPAGGGDPWVVDLLEVAAADARAAGAADAAAAYGRRALREPPPPKRRPALLRRVGGDGLAAFHPDTAAHLEEALALAAGPREAAALALELAIARYYAGRHEAAVDGLLDAIDAAGGDELREERLRLEAFLGIAGRYDLGTEERTRGRVRRLAATLDGATPGERLVRSVAALEAPGPTAGDLARAARLGEQVGGERPWPDANEGAGTVNMYLYAGRPDLAGALAAAMIDEARRGGSPVRYAVAQACRGAVALDRGDLPAAVSDLTEALTAMAELMPGPLAPTLGTLLIALADAGPVSEGERLLGAHGLDGPLPERMLLNPLLFGRGLLRLVQGRWREAAADLEELGRRQAGWGMARPTPAWRSAAALAHLGAGDEARARARAEEELALARTWDTPRAVAVAARASALVEGGDGAAAALGEAAALLDGTSWRLEWARIEVDRGAALRRAGLRRDARAVLTAAMDEAHACGAGVLAERAAAELRASGARPRRHALTGADALTPSERRVADLAAAGRTNRDIARHLFVTAATVETHLTRVYRKLDIAGREGLAAALGAPGGESPGGVP